MSRYVMSLDQGTTSSRAILFDHNGLPVSSAQLEFPQIYPRPGWVEHDPEAIWHSQMIVARQALALADATPGDVVAIGVANQRETTVVWDRRSGLPVYNAIVWQCRRTADRCEELKASGFSEKILARTGLVTDAYFSGTKLAWILDHVEGVRSRAESGDLAFGTIDSFLLWRLSGGKLHITDYSNASRTMLFDIHTLDWDEEILAELRIPHSLLPEVRSSSLVYGLTDPALFGKAIPLAGDAGDQQAATFGQACYLPGMAKNTYGTGCFMLLNTGSEAVDSHQGLLSTIAWGLGDEVTYALEGSVFIAGAAVQWLRDGLGIIQESGDVEALAASVLDNGGVYVVPAFVGLGAPHWDQYARGAILGLTRGSSRAHIARATLESIAFQTRDVLEAMRADSGVRLNELRVDGGASRNDLLMQFQADILGVPVLRPTVTETTALGAAYLAGLAVGFWKDEAEIACNWAVDRTFEPAMSSERRQELIAGWSRAIDRARLWADQ
jgi:glycerol kinase